MNIFKKIVGGLLDWKENRPIIIWLFKMGKTYRKYIFGFLIINMLTMGISMGSAVAGKYVVDANTRQWMPITIMLVTSLVSIAISSLSALFSTYMGEKLSFGIRARLYDRVQRSVWHKLSKYRSGDLLSRLAGDVDAVSNAIITMIPNAIVSCVQLLGILFLLLYYDPMLALIGLIVGPLGFLCTVFFRKRYVKYQEQLRQSHSEYFSFLQETMSSVGVIKTFQLEDENNLRFQEIRDKRMELVLRTSRLSNLMMVLSRLVYGLGYVITFSWCAYQVSILHNYPYGVMTLFLTLVSQLEGSIRGLGSIFPQFYSLMVSAKRLYQISELEHEDYAGSDSQPTAVSLKIADVSFHYDDKDDHRHVLRNLDLTIPAGSRVGIVGASGAGKTTFIRLLLALIKPISGTVEYLDENGSAEVACPASRRFISYVPQGNTLLPGSVRANLLSGNPNATEEQMWQVLEAADAADFLRKSPQGLDTVLSHSAGGLSEGQAQRISIARALLRDKPVLILDEATSALDEDTESRIFQQISALEGKTCFIITHRKSMLRYCDRILNIDAEGHGTLTDNV